MPGRFRSLLAAARCLHRRALPDRPVHGTALRWRSTSLPAWLALPWLLSLAPIAWAETPAGSAVADAQNHRHSPLTQLTPRNVGRLQLAWRLPTGSAKGQQGEPLVIGDLLVYVSPWPHRVVAIDLATRRQRWAFDPAVDPATASRMCCGPVHRGLAYAPPAPAGRDGPATPGTLLFASADARLFALDAQSGRVRWQVALDDGTPGVSSTGAPRVYDGVVIAGIAGGEYGVRGHLDAYDLASGRRLWRGWSTGPDADLLIDPARTTTWRDGRPQPVGADSGLQSWRGDDWRRGGGTTWGGFAYDAARQLVIYGSGNPGSWNPRARPGDNRWTNALWARELRSGRVRWVFQMTPHDEWDYDGVNEAVLFDGPPPARRPLLAHFDRNGWVYLLDRDDGALVSAERYDPAANWARAIDARSGRPEVDPARSLQAAGEDETVTGVCPAAIGAKNQAPVSHDPARGLFFVPMVRLCMDIEAFRADFQPGQPWIGASYTLRRSPAPGRDGPAEPGALLAWDAGRQAPRWTADELLPLWGGVLSTATGLVFHGTLDGLLKARDAADGRLLWTSQPLASGVVGSVTSWTWRGRQYIGVFAGTGGLAADPDGIGTLDTAVKPLPPREAELVVFALPPGRRAAGRR